MKKINKKGFTLIELIVVIAILAVLALLLVPQITGYITQSKDSVGFANARSCYSNYALAAAKKEANLTAIQVDEMKGCILVGTDTAPTGAKWKNPNDASGKTYEYDAKNNTVKPGA